MDVSGGVKRRARYVLFLTAFLRQRFAGHETSRASPEPCDFARVILARNHVLVAVIVEVPQRGRRQAVLPGEHGAVAGHHQERRAELRRSGNVRRHPLRKAHFIGLDHAETNNCRYGNKNISTHVFISKKKSLYLLLRMLYW